MLYSFIAIMLLLLAYVFREQEWATQWLMAIGVFMAACFLAADAYTYVVLPDQINSFYNSGAGTPVGANYTMLAQNDSKLAYYAAETYKDYVYMEWVRTIAYYALPLVIIFLVYKAFMQVLQSLNMSGKKGGNMPKDGGQV